MSKTIRRYILDYDASREPPAGTGASAEIFSGLIDLHMRGARILEKKNPFVYPSSDVITVKQGTIIALFNNLWRTFEVHQDIELTAGDIDAGGSFQVGTDYYIYLVDDGGDGFLAVSANSTYPEGQSADNTRKIGGFHYGHIRCVNEKYAPISPSGAVFGTDNGGWRNNVVIGVIPNSIWDLNNRPLCSPEGMVLIGNIWVDIYAASVAEAVTFEGPANGSYVANGRLQSKYGQLPVTGTEGLNWYSFQELAARSGKRLLGYGEWCRAAYGNPGGEDGADNYGWTKTSNTARTRTGCNVNASNGAYVPAGGIKPYAVSAYNIVDAIGNAWEWVDELTIRQDSTTWVWQDVLGTDKGKALLPNDIGMTAFHCGARWADGVWCGGRSISLAGSPWNVNTLAGSRLACDAA
jgi:formylglycine-generating enzyme required for sulfatase activity